MFGLGSDIGILDIQIFKIESGARKSYHTTGYIKVILVTVRLRKLSFLTRTLLLWLWLRLRLGLRRLNTSTGGLFAASPRASHYGQVRVKQVAVVDDSMGH